MNKAHSPPAMKSTEKLNGLVIKVAGRCNLNCTYCYMYNMGDESYRFLPKVMTVEITDHILNRVINHCLTHGIREFEFIFHGGEPLLAGPSFYQVFVEKVRAKFLNHRIGLKFGIQTNGTLLTSHWCKLFKQLSIHIGISVDGPARWHDQFRVDHQGKGTYERTMKGLLMAQNEQCAVGLLSVINVKSEPVSMYEYYKALKIKHLDFLWPDYNHEQLPQVYQKINPSPGFTPYGDWWIAVFDRWFSDKQPKPGIRFLNHLVLMILGIDSGFESIGQAENRYLIIETDGSIEASDYLKACGDGFTKEGFNVKEHELSAALKSPLIDLHRHSHRKLCKQCRQCVIKDVCGGGHIAHRFKKGSGFDNPSVYCYDLMKLITHVQNRILEHLSKNTIAEANLGAVSYQAGLRSIMKIKSA